MQAPPWQLREQQSSAPAQLSPSVLQAKPPAVGSGAQTPLESVPVQHSPALAAGDPVAMQRVPEQTPPRHETEQQSPSLAHARPGALQNSCEVHLPDASQVLEQQSPYDPHASPLSLHAGGGGFAHLTVASQTRPVWQQAPFAQDAPAAPHVGAVTHLPRSHESVSQQSPGPLHAAFTPLHVVGVVHFPLEHTPVQQSPVTWHAAPCDAQAGGVAHAPAPQ
jgi:hypothetical protein